MITIKQTSGNATTVASPTTFTPVWSATAAGSTLLLVAGLALSGAPTVTPPAGGWQLITSNAQGTSVAVYIYALVNAPAGTTSLNFVINNVNGAAWQLFELAGAAPGPTPTDSKLSPSGQGASVTALGPVVFTPRTYGGTLDVFAVAYLSGGGAYTAGNNVQGVGATVVAPTQTSTTGATTVSLSVTTIQQGPSPSSALSLGGSCAAAAAAAWGSAALLAADSQPYVHSPYGGATIGAGPASFGGL